MGNLFTQFSRRTSGSIAVMGAIFIGVIAMTTTFVLDYSKSTNERAKIQRAADAATLVAASTYRDDKNKGAALKRASDYFDDMISRIDGVRLTRTFDVGETENEGEITASGEINVVYDSLFKSSPFEDIMRSKIEAVATISQAPQDLYLVLLVDSTASMNTLIDSVRDAAHNLETEVREKLLLVDLEFNRLYVKVAFFGDLRTDKKPYGWRESPLYDLSQASHIAQFRHFVATTPTYYGGDLPESSPAAIAHFLTAPLPAPLQRASTVQSIVVWTDASGLPLDAPSYQDDVTVSLYKKFGNLGEQPRRYYSWSDYYRKNPFFTGYGRISTLLDRYYYNEDTEHDGDATGKESTPPSYGCCSTFEIFEDRWRNHGAVPLSRRTLGLIVPTDMEPWKTMAKWQNVTTRDYGIPSASGIVDDVVDSLNGSYSPLALSR